MIIPSLFILLLILSILSYLLIGKHVASSTKQSMKNYFLGDQNLGTFTITMTILATQLGGGTIIGSADYAFKHGLKVIFYPLGMCLGFFLLASGLGKRLRESNVSTIAELFEKIYHTKTLRICASLLSIISLFFILVAMAISMRKLFISMGMDSSLLFFVAWISMVIYTVIGGLKAVVHTDTLQIFFIIIVLIATLFFAWMKNQELFSFTYSQLMHEIATEWKGGEALKDSLFQNSWTELLLSPMLFMIIGQDMGQRCFSVRSPRMISHASYLSIVIFFSVCCIPMFFGFMARKNRITIPPEQSVFMAQIAQLTSPITVTFFAYALFIAIVSTADSIICAISSNLSLDFFAKKTGGKCEIWISRTCTLFVGLLAYLLSYSFKDVVDMLLLAYNLSMTSLSIPVIMSIIHTLPHTRWAAIFSFSFGCISYLLLLSFPELPLPREILSLSLSFLGFVIGSCIKGENLSQ